jgi:hypothetical protein
MQALRGMGASYGMTSAKCPHATDVPNSRDPAPVSCQESKSDPGACNEHTYLNAFWRQGMCQKLRPAAPGSLASDGQGH